MKFTVFFKPNTSSDYGLRLIGNHIFLRSRAKSIPLRMTYANKPHTIIEKAEIFVSDNLIVEMPVFFAGELEMLSPQISRVERS